MTQRIFDIENEKDMVDLWDILPDNIDTIRKINRWDIVFLTKGNVEFRISSRFIRIEWHNKTEITRPIQEASEADLGKLCYFWDYDEQKESGTGSFGKLCIIDEHKVEGTKYQGQNIGWFPHCRRLTKQEIEELC